MDTNLRRGGRWLPLVTAVVLAAGGCAQSDNPAAQTKGTEGKAKPVAAQEKAATAHSGWWCDEHGIPEAECSMCSAKVAKAFKAKGDWCELNDRAKSQCFVCDPKLKEKYAAIYRAKEGKEPPPTEDAAKDNKDAPAKKG